MRVVLDLLTERVRQASEAAHVHPHREVLALDVRRADVFRIGIASDFFYLAPEAHGGAVARFVAGVRAVDLHEHRVIDIRAERILYRVQIGSVAVCRELHAMTKAAGDILHEAVRRARIARADEPRHHELRIRTNRRPRPNVAVPELPLFVGRNVLRFRVAEGPNLIALDALAGEVIQCLGLIPRARASKIHEQLFDRHAREAGDSGGCAEAVALHEDRNDPGAVCSTQAVHIRQYTCSCKYCQVAITGEMRFES